MDQGSPSLSGSITSAPNGDPSGIDWVSGTCISAQTRSSERQTLNPPPSSTTQSMTGAKMMRTRLRMSIKRSVVTLLFGQRVRIESRK